MRPEDFQIFLKLADGSFHPLVSANGKRRLHLTITTAHNGQQKAVFGFYAKFRDGAPFGETDNIVADNRVASLEIDLSDGAGDGPRDLALSVDLDLFDNLSLSVADPVSGSLKTAEVSLSEWLLLRESPEKSVDPSPKRLTSLKVVFLVLFVLVSTGLVLFGAWYLATHLTFPPPPPLTALPGILTGEMLL